MSLATRPHVGEPQTERPLTRSDSIALLAAGLVIAVIPLTFLGSTFGGVQPSGYAWVLILALVAPLVAIQRLRRRPLLHLAPYLAYLAYALVSLVWIDQRYSGAGPQQLVQLAVPAACYLLAWRLPVGRAVPLLAKYSRWVLVVAAGATLLHLATGGAGVGPLVVNVRPLSISLSVIFVLATVDSPSMKRTLWWGLLAIAVGLGSGSRSASAVIVLLVVISPSLTIDWRGRAGMALASLVLIVGISQTATFRDRFFFNSEAGLTDVLTLSENLNTSGRRELWPDLVEDCGRVAMFGHGIGASYTLSSEYSRGQMPQPHNEPLRVYCDTGIVGSVLFWWFFVGLAARTVIALRRGAGSTLTGAAGQLVLTLVLIGATDNPIVYTAHFMAPAMLVFGLADRESRRAGAQLASR